MISGKIKNLDELLRYNRENDLILLGSLKTLVPELEFGGDEIFFNVWLFIITPDNEKFPATFYYGPSGMALGGWESKDYQNKSIFPLEFRVNINSSIFDIKGDKKEDLIEAFESALKKVPISDFFGIYKHDLGYALMMVKTGTPFMIELGWSYDKEKVKNLLEQFFF